MYEISFQDLPYWNICCFGQNLPTQVMTQIFAFHVKRLIICSLTNNKMYLLSFKYFYVLMFYPLMSKTLKLWQFNAFLSVAINWMLTCHSKHVEVSNSINISFIFSEANIIWILTLNNIDIDSSKFLLIFNWFLD